MGAVLVLGMWAGATQELVAPRVRVLYPDEALAPYAQRVAREAERALDALVPLFGEAPEPIVITVETGTDIYNAYATVLPRPGVGVRPLFPTDVYLNYRSPDELYPLLVHELMHVLQLAYRAYPEGESRALPRLGLVGENAAEIPPGWLLEGIAVWAESVIGGGGRYQDARTRGLLHSAALAATWPSLSEASMLTFSDWPGGLTRYLYGGEFFGYLVDQHGFSVVRRALEEHNAGGLLGDFASAWERAAGTPLGDEWRSWQQRETERAEARAKQAQGSVKLTERGWHTGAPVWSPTGEQLAWRSWPPGVSVARWDADAGELREVRTLIRDRSPHTLSWLDERTLIYARPVRRAGHTFSELFALDVQTGRERQLTRGERAKLPVASPAGCVLYVRDLLPEAPEVRRWCPEGPTVSVHRLPAGQHPVGLAVSAAGQVALSVWRHGFVDLALLDGDELRYLSQDAAQNLDPVWQGETHLVFRSDRDEVFDLYQLELAGSQLTRLTRSLGGAYQPAVHDETFIYVELGGGGFDLVYLAEPLAEGHLLEPAPLPSWERDALTYPTRDYSPWPSLLPYGWLPTAAALDVNPLSVEAGAALVGQDDSGVHSYALNLGVASALAGTPAGLYANLDYRYAGQTLLSPFIASGQESLGFGVRLGAWPHQPHLAARQEIAFGAQGRLDLRWPADQWTLSGRLELGALYLPSYAAWQPDGRATLALSNQRGDSWGYPTRGLRSSLTGVWSATPEGASLGFWGDLWLYGSLGVPGTAELGVRAGYRPARLIPLEAEGALSALATLGYRRSVALEWRYGDGRYALERLSLTPRARVWLSSSGQVGVGADLTVMLDTLVNYGAPVSLGATLGYADGLWYRTSLRLPF